MGSASRQRFWGGCAVNGFLLLLVLIWSIPTLGLFISSWRTRLDIQTSGWWTVFPHREWQQVAVLDPKELDLDPDSVMEVEGAQATFERCKQITRKSPALTWSGNRLLQGLDHFF